MSYVLFIGGVLLVAFVFFDALWTALWSEGGAGPMTDTIGSVIWKAFKGIAGAGGQMNHRLLSLAGPAVLVATVVTWLMLMWTGMVMMFSSSPDAVVVATTRAPGDFTDRIWFVLYTSTTVGNGGFAPNTDFFQVVAGFIAASGMAMVTLAITYGIQVLSAVVDKRAFASQVLSFGESTAEIVRNLQVAGASSLSTQLSAMGERLGEVTEQHKSYPVLHYYHPAERSRSTACAVASLDEALRIYRAGVDQRETAVDAAVIQPLQNTIGTFLDELQESFLSKASSTPPKSDADDLREEGVRLRHPSDLEQADEAQSKRRRLLAGLVDHDGWRWDDVVRGT